MGCARHSMWSLEDSWRCAVGCVAALALLTACGSSSSDGPATSAAATASPPAPVTTTTAVAAPSTAQGPQTQKWIELQAGDCLADPPPSDPSVVTVSVVDCAIPHAAEVYLRADVAVDAAIADVADQQCDAGIFAIHGATCRRRSVGGDVPDRLQSRPDVGQSPAEYCHLPASGVQRWAADGIRTPLMRLHRDRLWHNVIRGRRWRCWHLEAQPGVVVVEVPARQAERGAPVGDSGFTGCARRVDRRRGNDRGCQRCRQRCRGERGDHKPSHRLSLGVPTNCPSVVWVK